MKIHFIPLSLPELRPYSRKRKVALIRATYRRISKSHRWSPNALPIALLAGYLALYFSFILLFGIAFAHWISPALIPLAPIPAVLLAILIQSQLQIAILRPQLRKSLTNRHGRPYVCFSCGYLLRGLPTSTTNCPECGSPIETSYS